MVFSSINFLFVFLPIALGLYFIVPKRGKNLVLLVTSLIFYAWGEPVYVSLMLLSIIVDYICGYGADKYRGGGRAKLFLVLSVVINLGLLGFFKYGGFLVENLNHLLGWSIPWKELPLPIGISFYTFQTMSYTIDVYRGRTLVQKNIINFGAYVSLFPQLIAGPIVRYSTIAAELEERKVTWEGFGQGAMRFITGLAKKVLLANNIGMLFEEVTAAGQALPVVTAWLGVFAFAFQLYFDFSGYSDMAIGLGKMFGFTFPENFNAPYRSQSISDFWRRWHITLGSWFRDYVYFPMGGSRCSRGRLTLNLAVVWLLTGLWHGAAWNFVAWGLYFGLFIWLEKMFLGRKLEGLKGAWRAWGHVYTLLVVAIGWVLFFSDSFGSALAYVGHLFSGPLWDTQTLYYLSNYGLLLVLLVALELPWKSWLARAHVLVEQKKSAWSWAVCVVYLVMLGFSVAYLVDATFNPFLYFRF